MLLLELFLLSIKFFHFPRMLKGSKLVRAFPAWGFSRFATSSDVLAKTSLQVNIHRSYDKVAYSLSY